MTESDTLKGTSGCNVSFITWNVKSLNHPIKRRKIFSHLKKLNAGIAFLQETHLRTADHSKIRGNWIGQVYHSNFNSKSRGTAILINKNIPFVMSKVEADPSGRYVIIVGRLYNTPVILANIYAPNWDNSEFFTNLLAQIPNIDTHYLILGGDMNCVLSPTLDRSSSATGNISKAAHVLKTFLNANQISDVWRFQNPTSRSYSFFSPVHGSYSRIDYFFADKRLLPIIHKCEYQAIVISDHAPLLMTLCIPTSATNYRPWRFNSLLLSDEKFVQFISTEMTSFLEINQTPGMPHSIVWESLKAYLRGQVLSYNAQLRKSHNARLDQLTNEILDLDGVLALTPTDELLKRRLALQTEFNLLSTKHTENLIFKTQSRTYEYGEKSGKILAHQLHQKTANHVIAEIQDESGIKHRDHGEINSCFHKYYSKLYSSESACDNSLFDSFFEKLEIPKVSNEMSVDLEEAFSIEELTRAVNSLQTGKSPGPDGFTSEFYKKFIKQLAPLLLSVFEESFVSGILPPTMRQAVVTLIPKKENNPIECSSYRPISLLNVDSKILSKMLASRLEVTLPSIISTDQTGFIKSRQSFFNLRRLFNILYDPSPPNTPEILVSLDAEKAFDRVEWDHLLYTLNRFGFGPKFISWIKVLYTSPLTAIQTNNTLSPYFALHRGTRQGCPSSPLLFAIAIEPLAVALRGDAEIEGIQRGGSEHKVSLYADDMLLFLLNPLASLPKTLTLLEKFSKISGYKINLQKSEIIPVNASAKLIQFNTFPLKVNMNKFKYLGIWVTHDLRALYTANFLPLLTKLKQDLNRWNLLPLSLGGRINTIKMNVLPKFLYVFQCVPIFISKSFLDFLDTFHRRPPFKGINMTCEGG